MTRERKYILILGTVLLLAGVVYRFYPQLSGFIFASEEVAVKEKMLEKYARAVEEKAAMEKGLIHRNRVLDRLENGLLNGRTPALAAVDIQNVISGFAEDSGVEINTMRVMTPEQTPEDPYLTIPVQFTAYSTVRKLKEILYKIETSDKILWITEMHTRPAGGGKNREQILSSVIVQGVMKKGGA